MTIYAALFSSDLFQISDFSTREAGARAPGCVDHSDFGLVRRGAYVCQMRGRAHVADPAGGLIYYAGDEYWVTGAGPDGFDCTVFEPAPEVMDEAIIAGSLTSPLSSDTQLAHVRLYRTARLCADRLTVEEAAMELLGGLARDRQEVAGVTPSARDEKRVAAARALIAADLSAPLGLSDIASEAACSPFHLARLFRSVTGRSLRDYRLRLRLAAALHRLEEGERDLTATALDVGFSSHSHMTAAFRRCFGAPPTVLRYALAR
ncbi:helix-turn-helix transcriptional regulator [Caulobacter sp. NIBR2454]|uniref:helix-turn-helix transcriptional regulator n=1 Tax=Caulobacter sp. NIBR2454 TaxID=3015996 RepID=UPI0022B6E8EC|nr:AraC family transcriptional regulator [Caulobacter sp. NIBR2454]